MICGYDYDLEDLDDYCPVCVGMGKNGGCPKCGMYPPLEPAEIDGVKYRFVTNAERGGETHKGYDAIKDKARVLFEKAVDCYRNPMPDGVVAIWLAIEDREIAKKAGLYVWP